MSNQLRPISEICQDFFNSVYQILSFIERKSKCDIEVANIDRLRKRISLLKETLGREFIIKQSHYIINMYSDKIINRDEDFLSSVNVKEEILQRGGNISTAHQFLYDLFDSFRSSYSQSSDEDKSNIFNLILNVHNCSIEYRLTADSF